MDLGNNGKYGGQSHRYSREKVCLAIKEQEIVQPFHKHQEGMMDKENKVSIAGEPHSPPPYYEREPEYQGMVQDRDVMVTMRDGVRLCVDVYRPERQGKLPALLAFAQHNKDLQTPEACEACGPQPAWSPFII
jgi:predicted acyl esterase